jgi:hypothetical protein
LCRARPRRRPPPPPDLVPAAGGGEREAHTHTTHSLTHERTGTHARALRGARGIPNAVDGFPWANEQQHPNNMVSMTATTTTTTAKGGGRRPNICSSVSAPRRTHLRRGAPVGVGGQRGFVRLPPRQHHVQRLRLLGRGGGCKAAHSPRSPSITQNHTTRGERLGPHSPSCPQWAMHTSSAGKRHASGHARERGG